MPHTLLLGNVCFFLSFGNTLILIGTASEALFLVFLSECVYTRYAVCPQLFLCNLYAIRVLRSHGHLSSL